MEFDAIFEAKLQKSHKITVKKDIVDRLGLKPGDNLRIYIQVLGKQR